MTTIEITLDNLMLVHLDSAVNELKTDRNRFIRDVLLSAIEDFQIRKLEEKHRRGYALYPMEPDEFCPWQSELN